MTMITTQKKSSYFPALDGLRGTFALAVLVAHVNIQWIPNGHILMDTFFSISAFLITLTLIRSIKQNNNIALITFTKRRLLRLYPALICCVIPYTIAAYFIVDNFQFIIKDAILTLTYLSNFSKLSNYVYPHFFGHTWSLAIEEHFYIIWPSLLSLLLIRKEIWKHRINILISIMAISITWRIYLVNSGAEWSRLYYASDTRIDAFIAGGLLAFLHPYLIKLYTQTKFFKPLIMITSLLMFAALYYWDPKINTHFIWHQPVTLLLSCAIIFTVTRNDKNIIERIFNFKILQWIGVRCYGMYLWHWPLIWLIISHTEISKPILLIIILPFTLFMAWFSYKYIEEPILRRRPKMPNS